jgi:alkylation response protein AidB-like acyl-CoA dehydrogenase
MPMGHTPTDDLKNLQQQAADFALRSIATRKGLSSHTSFPLNLWKEFGGSGMLGIGTPKEFTGKGLGYTGICAAGRAFARHGCCLGITLSWLIHEIAAKFIFSEYASSDQKKRYLPAMATGEITTSIAISEPGVGGHPKHLKTAAEKTGSGYLLTGEKTFLTNGPIADLFIVLAVSGYEGERKRYSAFIVPREAPGLRQTEPLDFGFLRPCPHGGIIMDACMIPEENLLGIPGTAYEDMALPFREVEDAMMMGPIIGAQEARLYEIVSAFREKASPLTEDISFQLGEFISTLSVLDIIALEAAHKLDDGNDHGELTNLILAFRHICAKMHQEFNELITMTCIIPSESYQALTHDLDHIVRFAGRVSRIKQMKLGTALISAVSKLPVD